MITATEKSSNSIKGIVVRKKLHIYVYIYTHTYTHASRVYRSNEN